MVSIESSENGKNSEKLLERFLLVIAKLPTAEKRQLLIYLRVALQSGVEYLTQKTPPVVIVDHRGKTWRRKELQDAQKGNVARCIILIQEACRNIDTEAARDFAEELPSLIGMSQPTVDLDPGVWGVAGPSGISPMQELIDQCYPIQARLEAERALEKKSTQTDPSGRSLLKRLFGG